MTVYDSIAGGGAGVRVTLLRPVWNNSNNNNNSNGNRWNPENPRLEAANCQFKPRAGVRVTF